MTEDEMVGWRHQFSGHELEQTPGDGPETGKPGVLQCMGLKVRHTGVTEQQPPGKTTCVTNRRNGGRAE